MSAPDLQLSAMLLGMPDENSLPTLLELALEHAWLKPAVEELLQLPLQQWQAEHTRLFINGYPKTPCAPFESIYRHGRMEGPACDELIRLYTAAGVSATDDIPADYLGTMLELAAELFERRTPAADRQLQVLRDRHLAGWLPQISQRLQRETCLKLYRTLGERLEAWITA